jgi:hypothetical protein
VPLELHETRSPASASGGPAPDCICKCVCLQLSRSLRGESPTRCDSPLHPRPEEGLRRAAHMCAAPSASQWPLDKQSPCCSHDAAALQGIDRTRRRRSCTLPSAQGRALRAGGACAMPDDDGSQRASQRPQLHCLFLATCRRRSTYTPSWPSATLSESAPRRPRPPAGHQLLQRLSQHEGGLSTQRCPADHYFRPRGRAAYRAGRTGPPGPNPHGPGSDGPAHGLPAQLRALLYDGTLEGQTSCTSQTASTSPSSAPRRTGG